MSVTLPQSSVEYKEDTSRGLVNTDTDNIVNDRVDTQKVVSFEGEMLNEQSNNLTNLEDGDRGNTDLLPSHWIIETVSYEDYVKQKDGQIVEGREGGDNIEVIELEEDSSPPVKRYRTIYARDVSSISTEPKRKSNSSTSQSTNNNKQQNTVTTDRSNKHQCKWPGCGKSFPDQAHLIPHERIHLDIKPFSCSWPYCHYSAVRKADVVKHVRIRHFKLPALKKDQTRLNIVDSRNPEDYVRVIAKLLQRRLE